MYEYLFKAILMKFKMDVDNFAENTSKRDKQIIT